MKNLFQNKRRIITIAIILVFVFLMMDLNTRLGELFRLTNQRNQMRTEVYQLRVTEQVLVTDVAYATSEASVKKWAYEEGHKSLPGDSVIIPMPPANFTPVAPTVVVPTPQKVENWEVWKALFFGDQ